MELNFDFSRIPEIYFGTGQITSLPNYILRYGSSVLLITGHSSFKKSERYETLLKSFKEKSIHHFTKVIKGEPTPENINSITREFHQHNIDVVVAVGGGSVLDGGKAVSAMLKLATPVEEYLEGVGKRQHDGSKLPFIAVPTTAGTGSEATKNAVITQVGNNGFKKSLRHENFVPDIALIDPELMMTCPPSISAACGMDAFTQLLESYVSTNASTMTEALAYSGIEVIKDTLPQILKSGPDRIHNMTAMSYGSLLSGITLANAGLGIVHGLASSIGSLYPIPHGVVCGTLVGVSTRITIEKLRDEKGKTDKYLKKYGKIGSLLSYERQMDLDTGCNYLISQIEEWIRLLKIPTLGDYGFNSKDIEKVINETGQKYNPVKLTESDIRRIIEERV